jgi:hypothetical protein
MVSNRVLWTLPRSAKNMEVEFVDHGGDCLISVRDPFDPMSTMEMRFLGVVSYSFTGEPLCTHEHIEAYDKVVELAGARWGEGLATDRVTTNRAALHHYRVFLDARGAYDLLAEAFLPGDAHPGFDSRGGR